ncbi:hypothetical protein LTR84_012235 [Exophiala bonariae]|uniref:Uncharacterized protein n=1 Tax=Exophiala bonariae TaxID=1690606 RepID=A0AAV9NJB2_9EURO|nr:hypothetical protein LTR84_012235 [Exophiala bonariae]
MYLTVAALSLIHIVAGDISVQAFTDTQCAGSSVGTNVHSNPAGVHDGSGCIASSTFNSINTISVDAGFQCNIYSDTACQNFLTTAKTVGCLPVIGQGIICFSQESFDNPLAGSKAVIGIGKNSIIARTEGDIRNVVDRALTNACGNTVCDPNTNDVVTYQFGFECESGLADPAGSNTGIFCDKKEKCTQTVSTSGDYDNTEQRDYMKELLKTTMKQGTSQAAVPQDSDFFKSGASEILNNQLSFAQVVINDPKGANLAQVCYSKSLTDASKTFETDNVLL